MRNRKSETMNTFFLDKQLCHSLWICELHIIYIDNHTIEFNCTWLDVREDLEACVVTINTDTFEEKWL